MVSTVFTEGTVSVERMSDGRFILSASDSGHGVIVPLSKEDATSLRNDLTKLVKATNR